MGANDSSVSLTVAFVGETKGLDGKLAHTRKEAQGLDDDLRQIGQIRENAGGVVLAGTAVGLGLATKAAGDLAEAQSKNNAVFGESIGTINEFADGATDALALSKREALEATGTFGNMFTQLDFGTGQAAEMSKAMIALGGDFAAYHNANPVEVIEAQTAAFRGEYDALQKFVPTINAATVEKRALADSGKTSAAQLTAEEKALATYNIMLENAGAAEGAAAREKDGLAMSSKRAKAELENSAATLGEALVPAVAMAAKGIAGLAEVFGMLPGPAQTLVVGVGGLTLGLGLLAPKIREGVGLLQLAGSKSVEFARNLAVPTSAVEGLGSVQDRTAASSRGLSSGLAGISPSAALGGAALIGLTAVVAKYYEEQQKAEASQGALAADIKAVREEAVSTGKTVDEVFRAGPLSEFAASSGEDLQRVGVSLDEVSKAVLGTEDDWQRFADTIGGRLETGADVELFEEIAGLRAQLVGATKETELQRASAVVLGVVQDGAAGAAAGHAAAQGHLSRSLEASNEAISDQVDKATELFDLRRGSADAADAVADAVVGVADAEQAEADAVAGVAEAKAAEEAARRGVADARGGEADAVQAVSTARAQEAKAVEAVGEALEGEEEAAAGLAEATEDLAQAKREAAGDSDAQRDAMQGVIDKSEELEERQADELATQEDLTAARENYGKVLEDLAAQADAEADGVLRAEIRLRKAQEDLATLGQRTEKDDVTGEDVIVQDPVSTDDRLSAELDIRDAERALAKAHEEAAAAAALLRQEDEAGVEGSQAVTEARDEATAATGRREEAEEALEGAVQTVADTQVAANDRVTAAEGRLEDAVDAVGEAHKRTIEARAAVVEAQRGIQDAVQGVADAKVRTREAIEQVEAAEKRTVDARGKVVEAEGAKRDAIGEVNDKLLAQITQQGLLDTATLGAKEATRLQIEKLRELARVLDPSDPLRRDLTNYITDLNSALGYMRAIESLGETAPPGAINAERQNRSAGPRGGGRADDKGPGGSSLVDGSQLLPVLVEIRDLLRAGGSQRSFELNVHGVSDPEAEGEIIMRRAARILSLEGA